MTVKISISLPDDLAERLSQEPNASAYVADALRHRMSVERTHELLRRSGYDLTDEDVETGRAMVRHARHQVTPELAAKADALLAKHRRQR